MNKDMTPDAMVIMTMDEYGIDRETAVSLLTKSFEATLRIQGEPTEKKINRKLAEMLTVDAKNRTPWFVNFMQAHYRKNLPAWEKLYDDAMERGQDPATVMSISEGIIMESAQERIELVKLAKQGKTTEEITEAAFVFDDQRTDSELYALIAKQIG